MNENPALTFAITLKRWFAANGWPQRITDVWAHDPGIQNPTGPWASQMCNAMKAAGYNPKADFFLALGAFNEFVHRQELTGIAGSKLRDMLKDSAAMVDAENRPFGAAEFWSLFAGVIQPPEEFASNDQFTEEDAAEWTRLMRDNFRRISLQHMCSRGEAWVMLRDEIFNVVHDPSRIAPEDLQWLQEILAGLHEPTPEELIRLGRRHATHQPVQEAMEALLHGESKKPTPIA